MNMKKIISLLLAFAMVFGMVTPLSQVHASGEDDFVEVDYKVENVGGKSYKVYKFTDLFGAQKSNKHFEADGLEVSEPRILQPLRGSNPELGEELNYSVNVKWTTYDLAPESLGTPVFFQIYDSVSKKAIAQTKNVTGKERSKKYKFYKLPAWNDSGVSLNTDDWEMAAPYEYTFDVRLQTGAEGAIDTYDITANIIQRSNPIYRAEYYTNKTIPIIEVQRTNKYNKTNVVQINDSKLTGNEYYSWAEAVSGGIQKQYYEGTALDIKKYGTDTLASLEISDDITAERCRMKMKAPGKTQFDRGPGTFENNDGTPYHYEVTGDHIKAHIFTIRQDLKVKFDSNGGTWKNSAPADQTIGHSMKLGDSWAGLGPINVPGAGALTPPTVEAGKPEKEFIGWNTDANATTALFTDNTYAEPITKDETFYAIYKEKAQGKVTIQYVDEQGTAIDGKYKIATESYPNEAKGNVGEAVDAKSIPEPKFIGYERNGNIVVDGKKYLENGGHTVEVPYKKLDSVIPEIPDPQKPNEKKTKPTGYVTVTFKAGDNGKINDGTADIKYFVNPKDDVKFGDTKISEPQVTANKNYDVADPKWSPEFNDAKKAETITADATFTAQYVKQKGTVTYKYNANVNNTGVQNPDTSGIPAVPTDATQYDVGTEVAAETNVANDKKVTGKTVPVEKNGVKIGEWTFGGWQPAMLTIKKNSQTDKNEFTGTWTFTEAGKKSVTYEFASGTNGEVLPQDVTSLLTKTAESKYVNDTVNVPTDTYNPVVISTGSKQGTWTFDGWYAGTTDSNKKGQSLKVTEAGPNKFIGVWNFAEKGKMNVTFEFAFFKVKHGETTQTRLPNNAIGQFKPTLPPVQNNKYVGSEIDLPKFEGDKNNVKVNKGDQQGTWKFDGWYKSTDTTFTTKLTAADAKVSATDADNKLVGKWILEETKTAKVKHVFEIDPSIVGDDKVVKSTHELPQGVKDQKRQVTTNYVGSTVNPISKPAFTAVEETIDGKVGTWTFVKWDKAELTVNEEESKNVFTGTWTWTEKLVRPVDPHNPIDPNTEVEVKFLKGEHGTLSGIALVSGKEENVTGRDELAYYVKKKATWAAMAAYIPTALADYGWSVANPSWKPVLPATDKAVEEATFTAQYVAKPTDRYITLTLDENYRGGRISDYDAYQGALIEGYLYRPHRRGYVFEGWSYNSRRLDEVRPGDRIEYSTILYAIWSKQKPKDDEEVEPIDTREVGEHKAYMFGYTDGTVRPNGYITRAEAAALVTRLLGLDTFASAAEPAFTDTPSSWYNKAINAAVNRGIMKGYPDKSFRPNAPITRAEFTQMISTIDNKPYGVAPFADVVGHWAERPIGSEYQAGRIKGYPDGTFRPNAFITRAEAVVILNKIFERNYDAMSAINAKNKESIKRFIDLAPSFWGFNDMVEATNTHLFKRRVKGAIQEDWVEVK